MTVKVTVRWIDGDNYGTQEFRIYRSDAPFDMNDLPAPIGVVGPEVREFFYDTVAVDQTYYYLVSTFVDGVESFAAEQSVFTAEENIDIEFFATSPTGRIGNIQTWTVPQTRSYRITAYGAQGATGTREGFGGKGAKMSGVFAFNEGDRVQLVVGQQGTINNNPEGPAGGGATFAAIEDEPEGLIQNGAVFVRRGSSLTAYDQAVVDLVTGLGFACDVIPPGDINTHDFTNRELLIMGAPGGDYTQPANASILEGLDVHIVSMCRHTSRNALSMSSSSGSETDDSIRVQNEAHQIASNLEYSDQQDVTLGTGTNLQEIRSLSATVSLPFSRTGDASRPGIAERQRDEFFLRRHCSYYLWDTATPEGLEFLEAVLTTDLTSFSLRPLIVAGGGGGYGVGDTVNFQSRADATTAENGKDAVGGTSAGAGGVNGLGGAGASPLGGGGAGWFSNATGGGAPGQALAGGAVGGDGEGEGGDGGFGGGGGVNQSTAWGACGGGGGYSGGGGAYASSEADEAAGGGGGSYNDGTDQQNEGGVNEGPGYILISPTA